MSPIRLFSWVLGTRTQSLLFAQQTLYPPPHLSSTRRWETEFLLLAWGLWERDRGSTGNGELVLGSL